MITDFKIFEQKTEIPEFFYHLTSSEKYKNISTKLIIDLPDICNTITNNNIKTITFKKEYDNYYLCLTHSIPIVNLESNDKFLSIDPGVTNIATGFSNIGTYFKIRNKTFKSLEKSVSKIQSIMDIKEKGSNNYKKVKISFNRLSKKLSNSNKDFQHKISKSIIDYCIDNKITKIIVGDIETKKLVESVKKINIKKKSKQGLNKSEQNRGTLSRFLTFIDYKSINQGIDFYRQEESYTSKTNCLTGEIMDETTLSTRHIKLLNDLTIDRDLNGSINIDQKAKVTWFDQIDLESYLRNINRMYLTYN
jgi:IS605 OrfB family transposase